MNDQSRNELVEESNLQAQQQQINHYDITINTLKIVHMRHINNDSTN